MRVASVLLVGCCLSLSAALTAQPSLDPEDVVRQVRIAHSTPRILDTSNPGFDDGEFLIDANPTYMPAPNDQGAVAVAFDGANFLVVWQDYRSNPYRNPEIYGARVTLEGVVLDPGGIVISQATDQHGLCPAVGFDGTDFLVVWQDARSGSDWDIYGARVTPQGIVLDSAGFVISNAQAEQGRPALGFDGANFLVAWQDGRGGNGFDVYGARVTPQGEVIDTAGLAISRAAHDQQYPAVDFDGANFLVVWQDTSGGSYYDIYGARVTPQGTVLDSTGIAISQAAGNQCVPALGFDGANFLVAWQDHRGSDWDIYGTRVTPQGTVLDTADIAVSLAFDHQSSPALAFDGVNYLVVWGDWRSAAGLDIYCARVTPQGAVLDSAGIAISRAAQDQCYPAIGFDGANFLAVWDDKRSGRGNDINGARVTPQGTVLDTAGMLISTGANEQHDPAIAFDGANYLVVWEDNRSGNWYTIYGARVTPQGTVLDSAGIAISQAPYDQAYPAVGSDGANFLVVWQDDRDGSYPDIYGARVTPQGMVLDSMGIVISQSTSDQGHPAVGFDGANFLVVWQKGHSGSGWDIYGARVTPQGIVLDSASIVISHAANHEVYPAVGFDGANFLVAWQDGRGVNGYDVYGARVTPQGAILDTAGFAISWAARSQGRPVLGFDGANFLVVWEDDRNLSWDIYGARVTSQGAVLDPAGIGIALVPWNQFSLSVGFDGANFLVVWEDGRSNSDNVDIYGARVTPGGTVFDCGSVVNQEGWQSYPRVCYGNDGQMFLVYQGWTDAVGGKNYWTYRIWGKLDPNPGIEESFKPQATSSKPAATIIRGVLVLPASSVMRKASSALLDISGRKVFDLKSGANDVRALAPGVYFIREEPQAASHKPQAIRKVVIQR